MKGAAGSRRGLVLWLTLAAGILLFVSLLVYEGVSDVVSAFSLGGWGLVPVIFLHLAVFAADTMGWNALLETEDRPSFFRLFRMWWIGTSVNRLLPVGDVGGEIVRARLLLKKKVPGAAAGASVVVGLTIGVFALLSMGVLAALLLEGMRGEGMQGSGIGSWRLLAGIVIFGGLMGGFYAAQRKGIFLRFARIIERLAGGMEWTHFLGEAARLDRAIAALYRNRRALAECFLWRLGANGAEVLEIWLALYFLGHPVSLLEAVILEGLSEVIRSAGFAIPGALGVQEGGFLLVGGLMGLPGPIVLALSLVKRVRDLALGLPGLAAWQIEEGAGFWGRRFGAGKSGKFSGGSHVP